MYSQLEKMFVTICLKVNVGNKPPVSRDRLVVRTLRCGRSNPGSNPGHGIQKQIFFLTNLFFR